MAEHNKQEEQRAMGGRGTADVGKGDLAASSKLTSNDMKRMVHNKADFADAASQQFVTGSARHIIQLNNGVFES